MRLEYRGALLIFDIVSLLMMLILSVLQFNVSVPSGNFHIAIVALVSIALMALTDVANGLIVTVVGFLLICLFKMMNWQNLLQLFLLVVVGAIIIAVGLPKHQRLTHQQTIWLGLAVGISQLVLLAILFFIIGWSYFGNFRGAVVELEQVFPAAILNGLLDVLLVPPFIFMGARLADKLGLFNHPDHHDDHGDHHDPPIIEMGNPDDHDQPDQDKRH